MGRAPCCDKANVKKGPWSPEEDAKLKAYIEQHGTGGNWIALPQKIGLKRCGKSCRLRWLNYLRPNIKHGGFSEEEDNIICSLYISIGSRWSIIAAQLPGRTDNDIKNYWNTRLKKKLLGKQRKEHQARKANSLKQEMKKCIANSSNLMLTGNTTQNPNYFTHDHETPLPTMPCIYTINQDLALNDQSSIRKLLMKLGGRFSSNDHHHHQQQQQSHGLDHNSSYNNLHHQNPLDNFPSSTTSTAANTQQFYDNNNSFSQFLMNTTDQYNLEMAAASVQMSLQGINSNFQMGYDMNPVPEGSCLEGLEGSSYNCSTSGPISAESTSWDGMGPLAYTQTVSELDRCAQPDHMLQADYAFEELHSRYIGLH
ncbi:hypothetical protein Scep_001266 [Stephania cephalantha]|uniref:Uncharacterized protein n=1 Tax=Stephania cephalantha TaxID=152367 RepID=A0AAP0Q3M2_9MAGN